MIRCVVFDFDGTLVLSNRIKRDTFIDIAADFPHGPAAMTGILQRAPGDRVAILTEFAAASGAADRAAELIERYTTLCEQRIVVCPERAGASETLAALRQRRARLHVNSSTPADALQRVITARYPAGTFDGVHGGYGCKLSNLRALANGDRTKASDVVMIGDGVDDLIAAREFGCRFIGVAGGTLEGHADLLIEDLQPVVGMLWP